MKVNLKKPSIEIIEKLMEIINFPLDEVYDSFINNYDNDISKNKLQTANSSGFKKIENKFLGEIYKNEIRDMKGLIGIDLPIIHTSKITNNKRLIIIAQDPLRNSKDFMHSDYVIVGTPYALHTKHYRKKHKNIYTNILEQLLSEFEQIYLTDVLKVWAESSELTKSKKKVYSHSIELLKTEIELFKPTHILAMGKLAQKTIDVVDYDKNTIKTIKTPHPKAHSLAWETETKDLESFKHKKLTKHIEISNYIVEKVKNKT